MFQCIKLLTGGGGHWPRKGVWGCAALKTPFSRLSCSLQGSKFKQKCQFTRPPLLRKFGKFSLYSLNFCPSFSSQAPKLGNFQFTSSQIWKFSVHKTPLSEANISSQALHFGNPGRTPLPEKRLSAPSPGYLPTRTFTYIYSNCQLFKCHSSIFFVSCILFFCWQTAEYAQTVNDSVIKPTREKVNDGTLFSDLSSGTKSWASKVKYALLKHLGKWLQTCWKGRGVRAQNPHGLGEFSPQFSQNSPCE